MALSAPAERPRLPYWDGVRACKSPDATVEDLQHFLETEAEDDFMVAIAGNPNATSEQIERASQHHADFVRIAALENPNVARSTVERIESEAAFNELDYREQRRKEGISPSSSYLEDMAKAESELGLRARQKLRELDKK